MVLLLGSNHHPLPAVTPAWIGPTSSGALPQGRRAAQSGDSGHRPCQLPKMERPHMIGCAIHGNPGAGVLCGFADAFIPRCDQLWYGASSSTDLRSRQPSPSPADQPLRLFSPYQLRGGDCHHRNCQSVTQVASQSLRWPVSHSGGQSVTQVASQSLRWPVSHSGGQSVTQGARQPAHRSKPACRLPSC
jgi:hypothetical protein